MSVLERSSMPPLIPAPTLEHLCDLEVTVDPPIDVGATPGGLRRVIPITGGTVRGPQMQGRVLAGGADFQLVLGGGTTAHLDARYVIELDDGSRIFVHNTALRYASPDNARKLMRGEPVDMAEIYFRCQPRLETAAPQWAWLNHQQFIGAATRAPGGVALSFYRVC